MHTYDAVPPWVQVLNPLSCIANGTIVIIKTEQDLNKYLSDATFMAAKQTGPCTIAYPKITAQQIEKLLFSKTKINGGLVIENAPDLTAINLATITTIAGELEILNLPKVQTFTASVLESVGSVVNIVSIPARTIDLSALVSVGSYLRITAAMQATTLDLSSLKTVGSGIKLEHVRSLAVFALPSMVDATSIDLSYCMLVKTILLPALETADVLLFKAERSLQRISAPLLESVSTFTIDDAGSLASLCEVGIKAAGIKKSITLVGTPKLVRGDADVLKRANIFKSTMSGCSSTTQRPTTTTATTTTTVTDAATTTTTTTFTTVATGTTSSTTTTTTTTTATFTTTTETTTTVLEDCAYIFSACSTSCETGQQRTMTITRQPSPTGSACPMQSGVPDCIGGDGDCPTTSTTTTTITETTTTTTTTASTTTTTTTGTSSSSSSSTESATSASIPTPGPTATTSDLATTGGVKPTRNRPTKRNRPTEPSSKKLSDASRTGGDDEPAEENTVAIVAVVAVAVLLVAIISAFVVVRSARSTSNAKAAPVSFANPMYDTAVMSASQTNGGGLEPVGGQNTGGYQDVSANQDAGFGTSSAHAAASTGYMDVPGADHNTTGYMDIAGRAGNQSTGYMDVRACYLLHVIQVAPVLCCTRSSYISIGIASTVSPKTHAWEKKRAPE